MQHLNKVLALAALAAFLPLGADESASAHGSGSGTQHSNQGHHMGGGQMHQDVDQMREMHRGHDHSHDFEVMERMTPEQRDRMMALMRDIGVAMPPIDPARGRRVFLEKGCVACHSVNGVGGDLGPALDEAEMPRPMNAFEFAALMWRGAGPMVALQEQMFGAAIDLNGQDLADLVAFAHDAEEQSKLTVDQIPDPVRAVMGE